MNTNTPLNQLNDFDSTTRLQEMVKQAYYRRDRQVPSNIADIVATLKADLLRSMPTVGILTIDQAIFDATNDVKVPLSPALFFTAIKNKFTPPYSQRYQDRDEWTRPDTEQDTLNLLDTMAEKTAMGQKVFCNWYREFQYLKMRRLISDEAWVKRLPDAKAKINAERVRDFRRPVDVWEGENERALHNTAMMMAVIDWLKACITEDKKPSQIIQPDERSYQEFRKTY